MTFNWSSVSEAQHVFVGLSADTNYLLGISIVLLSALIIYFRLRPRSPTREAVAASAFVATVVSILLRLMTSQGYSVVPDYVVGMCIVVLAGSMALLVNTS